MAGCSRAQTREDVLQEKYKVIESFFAAYGKKNYDEMYKYCTKEMKEGFTQTVEAIPTANLIVEKKIATHTYEKKEYISVKLMVETTPKSSIHPSDLWQIDILVEKVDGKWLITHYTTG